MKREFSVEFSQVSLFSGREARSGVMTFGLGYGEFIVFLGREESGKEVLLELCVGVTAPAQGTVKVFGVDWVIANPTEEVQLRQRVGEVFPKPGLLHDMTVFENVALLPRYYLFTEDRVDELVMRSLSAFGLRDHRSKFPEELSGYHSRLVALARARGLGQELIVIDDPFTGLDEDEAVQLMSVFESLRMDGKVTIIVGLGTASPLLDLADRVALVHGGRIIEMGTLDEVYESLDEESAKVYVKNASHMA